MNFIEVGKVQGISQVDNREIVDSILKAVGGVNMIDTTMAVTTGDIVITKEVTATVRHSLARTMVADSELTYKHTQRLI